MVPVLRQKIDNINPSFVADEQLGHVESLGPKLAAPLHHESCSFFFSRLKGQLDVITGDKH